MPIWSAEIKELETLYTSSIKGRFPELENEMEVSAPSIPSYGCCNQDMSVAFCYKPCNQQELIDQNT